METIPALHKTDWIRFQIPDRRVLEGFVQDITEDGRILIGKTPDTPFEREWYRLEDISVLGTQTVGAPV